MVDKVLEKINCNMFYIIKYGENDGKISKVCKNLVHCVFTCIQPHGDVYASVSSVVSNNNGKYPVVPHIVELPNVNGNMRDSLNIPPDANCFW
jgi:hypothetical protein